MANFIQHFDRLCWTFYIKIHPLAQSNRLMSSFQGTHYFLFPGTTQSIRVNISVPIGPVFLSFCVTFLRLAHQNSRERTIYTSITLGSHLLFLLTARRAASQVGHTFFLCSALITSSSRSGQRCDGPSALTIGSIITSCAKSIMGWTACNNNLVSCKHLPGVDNHSESNLQGIGTQGVADADQLPFSKVKSWPVGVSRVNTEKPVDCIGIFLTWNW